MVHWQGVRDRYNAHRATSVTLENLVREEAAEGHKFATACLVRLIRFGYFYTSFIELTYLSKRTRVHLPGSAAYPGRAIVGVACLF